MASSCQLDEETELRYGRAVRLLQYAGDIVVKTVVGILKPEIPESALDRTVGPSLLLLSGEAEKFRDALVLVRDFRWATATEWFRKRFEEPGKFQVFGNLEFQRHSSAHVVMYSVTRHEDDSVGVVVYNSTEADATVDIVFEGQEVDSPEPVFARLIGQFCTHCRVWAEDFGFPLQLDDSFCQTYSIVNLVQAVDAYTSMGTLTRANFISGIRYISNDPWRRKHLMQSVWNAVHAPATSERVRDSIREYFAELLKFVPEEKRALAERYASGMMRDIDSSYEGIESIRRVIGAASLGDDPPSILAHLRRFVVTPERSIKNYSLTSRLRLYGIHDWRSQALTDVRRLLLDMLDLESKGNRGLFWSVMNDYLEEFSFKLRHVTVNERTVTPIVIIEPDGYTPDDAYEIVARQYEVVKNDRAPPMPKVFRLTRLVYELDKGDGDTLFRYALANYASLLLRTEYAGGRNLVKRLTNAVRSSPEVREDIVNLLLQTIVLRFPFFVDNHLVPDYPELAEPYRPRFRFTVSDDDLGRDLAHFTVVRRPDQSTCIVQKNASSPSTAPEFVFLQTPPAFDFVDMKEWRKTLGGRVISAQIRRGDGGATAFDTLEKGSENVVLRAQIRILDQAMQEQTDGTPSVWDAALVLVQKLQAMSDSVDSLMALLQLYAGPDM